MESLIVQWIPFFPTSGFFNGLLHLDTDIQGVLICIADNTFSPPIHWSVALDGLDGVCSDVEGFLQGVTTYTCGLISGISEIEAFDSILKSISQV